VKPLPAVDVPPDIARLLSERARLWNDKKAIGDLFTEDSVVYTFDDHTWIRGRAAVADFLGGRFARPYAVTPAAVHVNGADGYLVGYFIETMRQFFRAANRLKLAIVALGVYAEAIQKGDPRTKNLYFDVATVADEQSEETLKQFAARIRQIGVKRVLYEEFRAIAANIAPYFNAGSAARR
jgi:hypothetical protein